MKTNRALVGSLSPLKAFVPTAGLCGTDANHAWLANVRLASNSARPAAAAVATARSARRSSIVAHGPIACFSPWHVAPDVPDRPNPVLAVVRVQRAALAMSDTSWKCFLGLQWETCAMGCGRTQIYNLATEISTPRASSRLAAATGCYQFQG
eukprot:scaffold11460_cov64-Phaeocystis_antarctica.AAC.18